MGEQIRYPPLQSLVTGGRTERGRLASFQNPWLSGGGLQRRGGPAIRLGRVVAERVDPAVEAAGWPSRLPVQKRRADVAGSIRSLRGDQIIHRVGTFAILAARRSRTDGTPVSVVAHEDVLVLRKHL